MKNTKTTNILLIIIIVILLAPGLLLGLVYVSSVLNMGSGYTTSSSGVTQKLPRAAQYSTPRQVADMVDNSCRQIFRDTYSTTLDESRDQFLVDVWMTTLDDDAIERTRSGENPENVTVWNNMVRDLTETADTMQRAFNDNCREDITVVLSLCNPEDHSTKYLTIANGIAGYDIVNGTDMRKVPET